MRAATLCVAALPLALFASDNGGSGVAWGPSTDFVESHMKSVGLENGQVAFSLDEERNPPRLTSLPGFPYFGGVVSDGHVDVWRVVNSSPEAENDAIDFLAREIPPAGETAMLIVWKTRAKADGKYPKLKTEDPFFVRGYFSGSSVAFRADARFVVLDAEDRWWVSEESNLPNQVVEITRASLAEMHWSACDPKANLLKIGEKLEDGPESVKAVGILFSITNRSEEVSEVGGSITAFRANLSAR